MSNRGEIECWLTDMDGVLVHENIPCPGPPDCTCPRNPSGLVGKPNPMMFRSAMNKIGAHSENTG